MSALSEWAERKSWRYKRRTRWYYPLKPLSLHPHVWLGKTHYTVALIVAFSWGGVWKHVKVRLWIRQP